MKPIDELIELALQIAISAHQGQTDKMGKAYILHPLRVAYRCKTDEERIVAILSVTCQPGETYEEFVQRAARNPHWQGSEETRLRGQP